MSFSFWELIDIASTANPVCEIYVMVHGEKVEIENLHYSMTREAEPIFQMGTPIEWTPSHRRSISGSFEIKPFAFKALRGSKFDVHINDYEGNRSVSIKGLEVIQSIRMDDEDNYHCSFIARDVNLEQLKQLEEMTNRELAKLLLEGKY